MQFAGDRVRINAALVDAAESATLWSERYDRSATNVLALQDEIAWQVAAHLAASIGSPSPDRPSLSQESSAEAHDAYLRGLSHMRGRSGVRDASTRFNGGIAATDEALRLDPLASAASRRRLGALFDGQRFDEVRDTLDRDPR